MSTGDPLDPKCLVAGEALRLDTREALELTICEDVRQLGVTDLHGVFCLEGRLRRRPRRWKGLELRALPTDELDLFGAVTAEKLVR